MVYSSEEELNFSYLLCFFYYMQLNLTLTNIERKEIVVLKGEAVST
jgi:hypothetical protein